MTHGGLRSDAGLSLIEIMVAMFIVGLASGFVVLSLPRTPTPLAEARLVLDGLLNDQRNAAVLGGEPRGLVIDDHEIRALVYRRGEWQRPRAFAQESVFQLPSQTELEIAGEEDPVFQTRIDQDAAIEPDIWFDPSGFATEALLELDWNGDRLWFAISEMGEVSIHETEPRN